MSKAEVESEQTLPEPEVPDGSTDAPIPQQVYTILRQYPLTRLHDSLLSLYYHCIFDGWEWVQEIPNHLIIRIPDHREDERSDASIARARREADGMVGLPYNTLTLRDVVKTEWRESDWEQYRQRQEMQTARDWYDLTPSQYNSQRETKNQVGWILQNHPDCRDSDKELIRRWSLLYGGWVNRDGDLYAVPKAWRWQSTTPASITRARRQWQRKGLWKASEEVEQERKDMEQRVRQAYREGDDPWEVLQ